MNITDSIRQYDELIHLAYEGADKQKPWLGFVKKLADAFDAYGATFLIYSKRRQDCVYYVNSSNRPGNKRSRLPNLREVLRTNFSEHPAPALQPMTSRELCGKGFWKSQTYTKYLRPFNLDYCLLQDLHHGDDLVIRLCVDRTNEQGNFGNAEKQLLSLLTPHLRRSLAFRSDSDEKSLLSSKFFELLSRISIGAIVIDADKRVLSRNEAAEDMLHKGYGISISNGRINLASTHTVGKARQALDTVVSADHYDSAARKGMSLSINFRDGSPALDMVVMPLSSDNRQDRKGKPAAMILLNECKSAFFEFQPGQLQEIYKLTEKEAQLLTLLANGLNVKQAAQRQNVSINTVNTHRKSLYAKLGIHNRSSLLAMLSRCTAQFV